MCGNVTLLGRLGAGERSALPERVRVVLERMLRVSQMRGAQSGGGAVQVEHSGAPRQVLEKCVNPKRGDLAARLSQRLSRAAARRDAFDATFLVQAHVRYATAGISSVEEAHPFQFLDARTRGPRRIVPTDGAPEPSVRAIETTLSHNGDMDALRFRGVRLPYPALGFFLERVLWATNQWQGDSPMLAGAIELFVTRGMWHESLRLAYQLVVAPPPPDLLRSSLPAAGKERVRALRRAFAQHPAPAREELEAWARIAERAWQDSVASPAADGMPLRHEARKRLAAGLQRAGNHLGCADEFARVAVDAFLDNDLYAAVRALEPFLEGTFGCVVTSSLEPGRFIAFTRGQPLSIGWSDDHAFVAVVSERAALKVHDAAGKAVFSERIDLDLGAGELAVVELGGDGKLGLALYDMARGAAVSCQELEAAGRVVALESNPYVTPARPESADRATRDLEDVADVLARVRLSFQDSLSPNLQTARAFTQALLRRRHPHLVVVGITNDLWLAEQFVKNLKTLFPGIRAEAKSSNAVLKETGSLALDENTVVLVISQSGQDFPTLGSLLLLKHRLACHGNDSLFALTSELDTLMGDVVGQRLAREAHFDARIFVNQAGFRPSEAATLSVNATHHTLVEMLIFLARAALDTETFPHPPHGFELTRRELDVLRRRRDATVDRHAPEITGKQARANASQVSGRILARARRWKWHVLEGVLAFALAILVLELNLQFRAGIEPASLLALVPGDPRLPWLSHVLGILSTQANVAFYAFLAPLAVWLLRSVQRRPALHRHGVRELLIGDTRYVHQIAWLLARRLFSLSYGFASIKPYSADCQDDLVLTHEPVRGTLGLFGLPDGRRRHLGVHASAALMTAKQFYNSRSLAGTGAEIVTIGHGALTALESHEAYVALPSGQPESASAKLDVLVEDMFDSWERLLAMQVFLNALAVGVSKLGPFGYDRSRTKDQVFAPTTAAPVSGAAVYELIARAAARAPQVAAMATTKVITTPLLIDKSRTGSTLVGLPSPPLAMLSRPAESAQRVA